MTLRVAGYDPEADNFNDDTGQVAVELVHTQNSEVVASWSLEQLSNAWNRKHASTIYVRSKRKGAGRL